MVKIIIELFLLQIKATTKLFYASQNGCLGCVWKEEGGKVESFLRKMLNELEE